MAGTNSECSMDPNSGFCSLTKTYHSIRPNVALPPPSQPLSITQFIFSRLHSTTSSDSTFLIGAATGNRLSYSDLLFQTKSLALCLRKHYSLSKGDVAFILSPHSFRFPILSLALLSLGVIISPAMPGDSISDINHLVDLCNPTIAFTNSRASHKLPSHLPTVLLDSPEYLSFFTQYVDSNNVIDSIVDVDSDDPVSQQDGASIFYSSGTSGPRKGVFLTHRNWIASTAATAQSYHIPSDSDQALGRSSSSTPALVSLATRVYTAAYGLSVMMRAVFMGETLVFTGSKFEIERVLEAVDKYKPDYMPVSPSEIQQLWRSELTEKYDLSSLKFIQCSGAPLGTEVADKFRAKFPNVKLAVRYGLTETTGAVANMRSPKELERVGSVGRLVEFMEAKIIDPVTAESLPSGHQGELWLHGPSIMKCYVGDDKATAEILDSEGWLKTGDLCYFDSQGFLFIVDRLKEVIKYNNIKIAPAELEHLLVSNHEIDDAVVVPYPDEKAGEIPMAFVVRNPGSNITDTQVMDFIATQVAPYKMIRRVAFISSIPKSANGKILRRELVNSALSVSSNTDAIY